MQIVLERGSIISFIYGSIEHFHHVIKNDVMASERHIGVQLVRMQQCGKMLSSYAESLKCEALTRNKEKIEAIKDVRTWRIAGKYVTTARVSLPAGINSCIHLDTGSV